MRIAIISDIHANLEALTAFPGGYDHLWVLGDLVNYGPNPVEAVDWVRGHATAIVRGNHDHSVGFDVDPRCSARFRRMAAETGHYTAAVLDESRKQFLRELPLTIRREVDGVTFALCHAVPSDPLHLYCTSDSPRWREEVRATLADFMLVGHTHLPFHMRIDDTEILNPGSLGQPKHGRPEACYAVWEDGQVELRSYMYAVDETVRKIRAMPLSAEVRDDLAAVLRSGAAPSP